jgi:adenylate cyclase
MAAPSRLVKWQRRAAPAVPGLFALIAVLLLQLFAPAPVDRIGLSIFDAYQRAAPRPYEDAPVRILDIDDETIRRLGQWPWPRDQVAALTQKLAAAGAAVVAYDIVFSEPDRTAPSRLAQQVSDPAARAMLQRLPDPDGTAATTFGQTPVVLGYFLTRDVAKPPVPPKAGFAVTGSPPGNVPVFTNAIVPLPALDAAATGTGFVSTVGDADGIVRRAPLIAKQGEQLLPSLSLEALRVAQQAGSITVKSSDASGESGGDGGDVVAVRVGQFEIPTTHAGELWLRYTAPQPGRAIPAWKLMQDQLTPAQLDQAFAGRIVFVGAGAIGLRDLVATPIEERAQGVSIHAQAVEQVILGKFLSRPDWAPGLERALLIFGGLALAFALPWTGAAWGAAIGAVAVAGMGGGSWWAFKTHDFLIDPTWPTLGLIAVYLAVTVVTYLREEKQRRFIHGAFDRYLSPELVKRIVDDPSRLELGGEEREMTVLFCDIRGFSRISEGLTPQDIIRFLIAFLTPMCDILLEKKATIDKFIGDAILAFWNAPLDDHEHHVNAARGALGMVSALKVLNETMQAQSAEPWPGEVKIGIGLNSGPCCVGNMGAAQRLSYSLIGDTVNLASRIEGLTKYYGVSIAIGSSLAAELPEFALLELDRVRVVGRDAPETLYALLGDEELALDPDFAAYAVEHERLLAAYRAREWDRALAMLDAQDAAAVRFGVAKLQGLLRERIAAYQQKDPGPAWDGVFQATEK